MVWLAPNVDVEKAPECSDRLLERDLRMLVRFVGIYCRKRHGQAQKAPARIKSFDVSGLADQDLDLCPDCVGLLTHALVKRSHCPMQPKPLCKHCPNHCYHPKYREQIREVMKFSGRHIVLTGRLDYLFHLLF